MDQSSHLILHLTPKAQIEKGITVMSRGEGVHVFDSEGNKYIDLVAGVTRPVHLGYGNQELAQAVYDQMMKLAYFTPSMFANEPAIKLAQVLSEITPGAINRFAFECDGSEAVETAMKLAKHYHYFKGMDIAPGFTDKVKDILGGTNSCSHLKTLVLSMASAAVQGFWLHRTKETGRSGKTPDLMNRYVIDTCWVWRKNGPLAGRRMEAAER